jgi:tetratricopeptide (TPR) repeat protein
MGRKRSGKRQHLYLATACLILLVTTGCAPVRPQTLECPACIQNGRLMRVEGLLQSGNFEGAIKESQELLARSTNGPLGDEALMELGLISAHYANPKKDYQKALGYFLRLTREFPKSPLAEEAKVWAGVLRAYEKAIQVDLDIEEMKKDIGR